MRQFPQRRESAVPAKTLFDAVTAAAAETVAIHGDEVDAAVNDLTDWLTTWVHPGQLAELAAQLLVALVDEQRTDPTTQPTSRKG